MENVNLIIRKIIEFPDMYQSVIENTEEDIQYFHKAYEGMIEENIFIDLIVQSRNDQRLERFLSGLVSSVNPVEITNNVFSTLLKYDGEYRTSILIGLAHCPLSFFQLFALNELRIDEALYQLIKIYLCNNCFTEYDLIKIFHPWEKNLTQFLCDSILYCLDEKHLEKSDHIRKYMDFLCKTR